MGRPAWRRPAGRWPTDWSSAPRATSPYASGTPCSSPRPASPTTGSSPGDLSPWTSTGGGPRRAPAHQRTAHAPRGLPHTDARAVVHTHAVHATAVSTLVRELPPIHYMTAALGGPVRVAPYATYGSDELAENMLARPAGPHRPACSRTTARSPTETASTRHTTGPRSWSGCAASGWRPPPSPGASPRLLARRTGCVAGRSSADTASRSPAERARAPAAAAGVARARPPPEHPRRPPTGRRRRPAARHWTGCAVRQRRPSPPPPLLGVGAASRGRRPLRQRRRARRRRRGRPLPAEPRLTVHATAAGHIALTRVPRGAAPRHVRPHRARLPRRRRPRAGRRPARPPTPSSAVWSGSPTARLEPGAKVWLTPQCAHGDPRRRARRRPHRGGGARRTRPAARLVRARRPRHLGHHPARPGRHPRTPPDVLPFLHRQRLPVLDLAYRGDLGAPRPPDGVGHLGGTEWRDVDAAIRYAVRYGAEQRRPARLVHRRHHGPARRRALRAARPDLRARAGLARARLGGHPARPRRGPPHPRRRCCRWPCAPRRAARDCTATGSTGRRRPGRAATCRP